MKVLDAKFKPSGRATMIHGCCRCNGTIQLLVDKIPTEKELRYRVINSDGNIVSKGKYYFAELDGYVSVYLHQAGTTDGFAGHEFKLTFEDGETRIFKGCLWDAWSRGVDVPEYFGVSITEDPEVFERGHTFYAGYITSELLKEISNDFLPDEEIEIQSSIGEPL